MAVHFVGFRGEEFWSAVRVWGRPDFFHRVWDHRARDGGEFDPENDFFVFAKGTEHDAPSKFSFNDSEVF